MTFSIFNLLTKRRRQQAIRNESGFWSSVLSEVGIEAGNGISLKEREFELLLPIGALIASANSQAGELGGGFRVDQTGLNLNWPQEVSTAMGLSPSNSKTVDGETIAHRLLFEPDASMSKPSYWATLFGKDRPSLVMEYTAEDGHTVEHTHEAWLVWPWHFDTEEQQAALDTALAVHADLAEAFGWLAAAQRSFEGARSELFEAIAERVATRQ